MSIPAAITTELAFLQAQVAAASPLSDAPHGTITAMRLNAEQLVSDIDAASVTATGGLDTWTAPADPLGIVAGILAALTNAQDQSALADMRGYVGRSTANLNQIA